MIRVFYIVTWMSKYKNSVNCRYTDTLANGKKVTYDGTVYKFVKENDKDTTEISPLVEKILDQWSVERIDAETQRYE